MEDGIRIFRVCAKNSLDFRRALDARQPVREVALSPSGPIDDNRTPANCHHCPALLHQSWRWNSFRFSIEMLHKLSVLVENGCAGDFRC